MVEIDIERRTSLKELCAEHRIKYGAAAEMLRKLRKTREIFDRHIYKEGSKYILDDVAVAMLLLEKDITDGTVETTDEERSSYEAELDREYALLEKIRDNDKEIERLKIKDTIIRTVIHALDADSLYDVIYKILGREYEEGDEDRLYAYLDTNAEAFSSVMNNMEV